MTRPALVLMMVCSVSAWQMPAARALGGGGTAPGGPLSGTIRPACNGYRMDGTLDAGGQSACARMPAVPQPELRRFRHID